jgi:diguanylate cyclase
LRERVEQAISQRPDGKVAAVMVLDLDGFKEINDEHGHAVGDVVLREIASRWRGVLRRSETPARLGGDEFAVLATRLDSKAAAMRIGDRLVRRLNEPFSVDGQSLRVGVAVHPEHGQDFDTLLTCADRAMYAAKRKGGGCFVFTQPSDGSVRRASN